MTRILTLLSIMMGLLACSENTSELPASGSNTFRLEKVENQILLHGEHTTTPILIQNTQPDHRPYLHPILAPDTEVSLTQFSPDHHKHQTGLYWGFTRVNGTETDPDTLKKWFYRSDKPAAIQASIGRDFFHHPDGDYWKKISAQILISEGTTVKWQTKYQLLNAQKQPIMEEQQTWTFTERNDKYLLDLEWQGKAIENITINEFDYGGLFIRMPWKEGIQGEVINAARQKNEKAEGQRAMWIDVGMEIEGLKEWGHIAIFDHPDNEGFPTPWRVDSQLGVGPVSARMGDWTISKGETKVFRHQLVAYTGQFNDIKMNDWWADYVSDHGQYNTASLWGIAQQEGKTAEFLTPEAALKAMTVKDGYQVNIFASEPMITQPMAFCWDDRGRLWIAENRDYESRSHGFSNDGHSRILILEDTNHDGQADKKTVFLEGIPFPSAIAVGFDGLYLGAPPNLLFVPDKNGDDRADEHDIEVLLTGWGIRDRHETINSLHWGPDGWLYGLEGFATPSKIRKPKGKGKIYRHQEAFPENLLDGEGIDINGGVWRFHPVKKTFEVVAHGFSNPWGIDYDAKGQLFISACVIPHLFHIIPGGIYHRQGGKHFNPYVYQDLQTIVDHRHRSAHGGARIYQSDAFPADQRGRIFMANIHEHAVLSDILTPNGSGFTASHGDEFLEANNAQWIGFSMEIGPEGGLYVLDWHDADICGNEVLQKETGRVFRIMPKSSPTKVGEDRFRNLKTRSDIELIQLQQHPSDWHTRRARIILQQRAVQQKLSQDAHSTLERLFQTSESIDHKLKIFWTQHICGLLSESDLLDRMKHPNAYIRSWAIQFLLEDKNPSNTALKAMAKMARQDPSPVVRLYLAAGLQRMALNDRWAIAENLIQVAEDSEDPNIPLMLWFGIEPLITQNPVKAGSLAQKSKIPLISNHISRRLVDANELVVLLDVIQKTSEKQDLLEGMLAGLSGRTNIEEPASWPELFKQLNNDPQIAPIAQKISQQFNSHNAAKLMVSTLEDPAATTELKEEAIKGLAQQQRPELLPFLPQLLQDNTMRIEALRAVAAYEEDQLSQKVLQLYPQFNWVQKQEALQTLAARSGSGWLLAKAIKDGTVPKKEIPAYIALQLKRVVGNGFVEIWGPIDEITSDKQAAFAKYQRLCTEEAIEKANPIAGKLVFERTCQACHQMYGEGGILGPDLTGSNRANLNYLLSNVLDPSGEIQDDYKMVVITTQDGRTLSGNIIAENDQQIMLRMVGQDAVPINQSNIQSRETTPNSMMPEGLLNQLTDQEVLDLVAYMRTVEPTVGQ